MALFALFMFVIAGCVIPSDANNFRGSVWAPASSWEAKSAQLDHKLLAELEEELGVDHRRGTEKRLTTLEEAIRPAFNALPKNEYGNLGHSAVKYALHRVFVQKHGWFIRGLEPGGAAWNASSPAEVLHDQVPDYVQGLFEKRLGGRGFDVHEMAVLAATLEKLIEQEARKRVSAIYKMYNLERERKLNSQEANWVIELYLASYILGSDLTNMTRHQARAERQAISHAYPHWDDTQVFARQARDLVTAPNQTLFKYEDIARTIDYIGDQFGNFQNHGCTDLRTRLMTLEDPGTGCVRLSNFYRPMVQTGQWFFSESVAYLRQLGALDESDLENPSVIIPNYINGLTNCVASSSYYSVCCADHCEELFAHLERELQKPDAPPAEIVVAISALPPASRFAKRSLSTASLERLEEVARRHDGRVPLHSRLFSQWLHHAYPHECTYPHVSGTTRPRTGEVWMAESGMDYIATDEEMKHYVNNATLNAMSQSKTRLHKLSGGHIARECAPWSKKEELFVSGQAMVPLITLEEDPELWAATSSVAVLAALASMALMVIRTFLSVRKTLRDIGSHKAPLGK